MCTELDIIIPFICYAVKPIVHRYQKLLQCVESVTVALIAEAVLQPGVPQSKAGSFQNLFLL
jgi:hypothetical protein